MLSSDVTMKKPRAGAIPFFVKDGVARVKVMKPSDPDYGGTEWQMAKGEIDPGQDAESTAMKEAHEEVGLVPDNIARWWFLTNHNGIYVYAAEIVNPDSFAQPHWETGAATWLSLPDQLGQIRQDQQPAFDKLLKQLDISTDKI